MKSFKNERHAIVLIIGAILFWGNSLFSKVITTDQSGKGGSLQSSKIPFKAKRHQMRQTLSFYKSRLKSFQRKMSTDLLYLIQPQYLPETQSLKSHRDQMINLDILRQTESFNQSQHQIVEEKVYIYVYLHPNYSPEIIKPYVDQIMDHDMDHNIIAAWIEVKNLESLAMLEAVRIIRSVLPPLVRTGSITTEGDIIHRTQDVRTLFAQSGESIKVGIISDGVDNIAASQTTGDLPPSWGDLTVLSNNLGGDEGTAMLEIVHDMVPNAELFFHDCGDNVLRFNTAIDYLINMGCQIICDDIGWVLEPYFEDGLIASHITSKLATDNIIYVSSAGNHAEAHYQGQYSPWLEDPFFHDFSHGTSSFPFLYAYIPEGGQLIAVVQWDEPFGQSGNDYDMILYSQATENWVDISASYQDGNDDPLEYVYYTADASHEGIFEIWIERWWTTDLNTLEVYLFPGNGASVYSNNITSEDAIFGHPAVPEAMAVGAIDANDPGNDDLEFFSSRGPSTILFPSPETRSKPDLCGVDGVLITGAGNFGSWDGSNYRFYGTSASAPHVAAIAAQLWAQLPASTGDQIRNMLLNSSIDLGVTGFDTLFGNGRADALNTFQTHVPLPPPQFSPPPGVYPTPQDVVMTSTLSGVTIHYTTDNSDPTEIDPIYTAPVHISQSMTLKARSYKSGWIPGEIALGDYFLFAVTTPNGGENWKSNSVQNITWISDGIENIKIEYSTNNGSNWTQIIGSITASANTYPWTIPQKTSTECLIKITDVTYPGISDVSDANFSIYNPTVIVTQPDGGELWKIGSSQSITWTSQYIDNVKIEYSTNHGDTWSGITTKTLASTDLYPWTIPNTPSTECLVKITDASNPNIADTSNSFFTIYQSSFTITQPNGGETWKGGSVQNISWTFQYIDNIKLEYSTDNGMHWIEIVSSTPAASGYFSWILPQITSQSCLVRGTDTGDPSNTDTSDNPFTIVIPGLTIIQPNGGETWKAGSNQNITWTSQFIDNLKIEYSLNNGSSWTEIVSSTPASTFSYLWTLPNTASTACLIRASDIENSSNTDTSDNPFTMVISELILTQPNGGETWKAGSAQNITWTSQFIDSLKIDYSTDSGSNWTEITSRFSASTSLYSWSLPYTSSNTCLIQISDSENPVTTDNSDNPFTIVLPTVNLTRPSGGENWKAGTEQNIIWTSQRIDNLKLEYSTDGGNSWLEIISSIPASQHSYPWTLPYINSDSCFIRASDVKDPYITDINNTPFAINYPSIILTQPNGGEFWKAGSSQNITWTSSIIDKLTLAYSTDHGNQWIDIINNFSASNTVYEWTIPQGSSTNCLVKISDESDSMFFDISDSVFTIYTPSLVLTTPQGSETWFVGSIQDITWTSVYVEQIKLEVTTNDGDNWWEIGSNIPADPPSYMWTIPNTPSTECLLKATSISDGSVFHQCDSNFTIQLIKPEIFTSQLGESDSDPVSIILKGRVNPNGLETAVKFEYGLNSDYGNEIPATPDTVDGISEVPVTAIIENLVPNTTYNYRLVAENIYIVESGPNMTVQTDAVAYPNTYTLNTSYPYPNVPNASNLSPQDYKIIGLPGASNLPLKSVLNDAHKTTWQAYWDNGAPANPWIEYVEGNTFLFSMGRAFWILHKGTIKVDLDVWTTSLNGAYQAEIPLHSGWNLITNPFDEEISWNLIQAANDNLTDPIYGFDHGFKIVDGFKPYIGYYFFNTQNLNNLKIPFLALLTKQKSSHRPYDWLVHFKFSTDNFTDETVRLGVSELALNEWDPLDHHKPRTMDEIPSVYFDRPQWDSNYPAFASDIRSRVEGLEIWTLKTQSPKNQSALLSYSGIETIPDELDAYLIDQSCKKYIDCRKNNSCQLIPAISSGDFYFIVGETDSIKTLLKTIHPTQLKLANGFPNPFNQRFIIPVDIPEKTRVVIGVYNVLGKKISTIHSGQLDPGTHWFQWEGKNDHQQSCGSGIYFIKLSTDQGKSQIQKAILIR